jgi:predicted O-methyltransferase YrrM
MRQLEEIDTRDRIDGTPRLKRLRQIPPETGKFLALMASSAPPGKLIEIGTSAGYSTLWLALACRDTGRTITTFEVLDDKASLARETFRLAGVEDVVEFVHGDAAEYIQDYSDIAFCFLDAEKSLYGKFYDLVVPRLVKCGILIADNIVSHAEQLAEFRDMAHADKRVDAVVVPIGKGELICRKID